MSSLTLIDRQIFVKLSGFSNNLYWDNQLKLDISGQNKQSYYRYLDDLQIVLSDPY